MHKESFCIRASVFHRPFILDGGRRHGRQERERGIDLEAINS
jgi:hypothetical protein